MTVTHSDFVIVIFALLWCAAYYQHQFSTRMSAVPAVAVGLGIYALWCAALAWVTGLPWWQVAALATLICILVSLGLMLGHVLGEAGSL